MDKFWIVPILHTGSYIRCPKFCGISTKFGVFWHIFIQGRSIKFYGNPFSGSRAEACGQIEATNSDCANAPTGILKTDNACRGSKFVTLKYSDTRAFACQFRPTFCRNWLSISMILRKKIDYFPKYYYSVGDRGGTVVKVLCYKSEGRWFDPRLCHWNFSLT